MSFNLADMFELAVDHYSDREYIVIDGRRCTYGELEARANKLAHHLASQGIGAHDHVGIYAYNCMEWVETLWAVFKLRAVWININYRYVADELAYIFDNADLKALVFQKQFTPLVQEVAPSMPDVKHFIAIEDDSGVDSGTLGAIDYEAALTGQSSERDFAERSEDDLYMLYTGGTTGMPKGVVWTHKNVFFALGGGIDQMTNEEASSGQQVVDRGKDGGMCFLPIAPLMHGATQWGVMGGAFEGRKTVLMSKFDPDKVWELVEQEKINGIMITGDAMARPMIEAYEERGKERDLSSWFLLVSSAAIFSATVKDQYFTNFPNLMVTDSIGSSESGGNGYVMVEKDKTVMKGGPTVKPGVGAVVLNEETLVPLEPGTGIIGKVARKGYIPNEYYKDPKKSAETFVTGPDGTRYSMPGDNATLEADGTITMLGRGSGCINSGGEKIFPEEVEAAVKAHPEVYDAVVVGVPDDKWGSRVAAVVEPRPGTSPSLESIQEECRKHVAGYKVPRQLNLVEKMVRAPSGKPDYRWAKSKAGV